MRVIKRNELNNNLKLSNIKWFLQKLIDKEFYTVLAFFMVIFNIIDCFDEIIIKRIPKVLN